MKRIYIYSTSGIVQLAKSVAAALFITAFVLSALLSPVYSQENMISSTSTPRQIPDGDYNGVSDSLSVSDSNRLADLNVYVDVTHAWVGDLIIELTHENPGTSTARVTIINRPGKPPERNDPSYGCGGIDIDATLDDEATSGSVEDECYDGAPTIDGTFTPNNDLSVFDNRELRGTWTLKVIDTVSDFQGTLVSWGLIPTLVQGNEVHADFGYEGTELGTVSQPYNTLGEALNAVADYGEIIIKGGITSETFAGDDKIEKKVTIKPFDITTTATIGQQ
jgi:subtilisin-like proprotein convertase family protein